MSQEGCRGTGEFKDSVFMRVSLDAFVSGYHLDFQRYTPELELVGKKLD